MTYKYWLYYLDDDLYAYTDDKDIKKSFESMRNIAAFKSQKRNLSKKEVNFLAHNYPERKLSYHFLYGYGNGERIELKVALTEIEKITTNNQSATLLYYDIFSLAEIPPYVFNDDILNALGVLKYFKLYSAFEDCRHRDDIPIDNFDMIEDEFQVNTLNIFLNNYGDTFLKKG